MNKRRSNPAKPSNQSFRGHIDKKERARRNKRLFPGGEIIRPAVLDQYVAHFEQIALVFRALQANIEAQMKSSLEKRPQP